MAVSSDIMSLDAPGEGDSTAVSYEMMSLESPGEGESGGSIEVSSEVISSKDPGKEDSMSVSSEITALIAPGEGDSKTVSSDTTVDQVDHSDIEMSQPTEKIEDQQQTDVAAQPETPKAANQPIIYRWEIINFSQLGPEKVHSEMFPDSDLQWRILLFPKGDGTDHLSLYLEAANTKSFPIVHSQLTVINKIDEHRSAIRDIRGQVNAQRCLGFKCFMPLGDLLDPTKDFLFEDILIVKAEIFRCEKEENSGDMEKDNEYAENEVNLGDTTKDSVYERIKEEGGKDDSGKDTGYLGTRNLGAEHHDKEKNTRYLGIKNQGFTCYMNSFIQTLYHIPSFRKAVYKIPTRKDEIPSKSTPLALQRLFYLLQFGKRCVSTRELAASFGSSWQSFMMQDVTEFSEFLSSQLEEKMKGKSRSVLEQIFQVRYLYITECLHVDYKSTILDKSHALILAVEDCSGVYASFDKVVGPELLDAKFVTATMHKEQVAQRSMKFTHLPPVLRLQLLRFKRNANGNMQKINDRYEFPLELDLDRGDGKYLAPEADRNIQNRYILHSVLAHVGDLTTGHYYAFVRPTLSDEWYKFNDETVTKEDAHNAIEGLFGGNNKGFMEANAYMLVYIRESDKDRVMCGVDKEDIPQHLEERLSEENTKTLDVKRQLEFEKPVQAVHFRSLTTLRDEFTLELSIYLSYEGVIGKVAEHLGVDDHSRIQLTSHNIYTQKPNSEPIRQRTTYDLLQILQHKKQLLNILYYEVLDIPSEEVEGFKTLIIEFHLPDKIDTVDTYTVRMPKASNVGDSLDVLKTMVDLTCPGAELRMFEVFGHKIYKVFSPEEKIADLNDQYMTLRAEEISEEEKNLGPKDRMIRVYHFADATQVKVFGYPFFLVIHEEERFADIKPRLQKKAGVSDTVFARWKFAFFGLGNPEYLEDSDVLIRHFERVEKDTCVAWQPFLGIHHNSDSVMLVD